MRALFEIDHVLRGVEPGSTGLAGSLGEDVHLSNEDRSVENVDSPGKKRAGTGPGGITGVHVEKVPTASGVRKPLDDRLEIECDVCPAKKRAGTGHGGITGIHVEKLLTASGVPKLPDTRQLVCSQSPHCH